MNLIGIFSSSKSATGFPLLTKIMVTPPSSANEKANFKSPSVEVLFSYVSKINVRSSRISIRLAKRNCEIQLDRGGGMHSFVFNGVRCWFSSHDLLASKCLSLEKLILSGLHQDFKVIPCVGINDLGLLTKRRGQLETDPNFRFFRSGCLHFSFVIGCLHQRCGIFRPAVTSKAWPRLLPGALLVLSACRWSLI